jgi:hypothetical protein
MIDTMSTDPPIVIGRALLRGRLAWHQDELGNMSNIRYTSNTNLDANASAFIDSLLSQGALKVHLGGITHPGADGGVIFPDIPDDLEEDPIPVTRSIAWTTVDLGQGFEPYLVAKRNEPLELVLTDADDVYSGADLLTVRSTPSALDPVSIPFTPSNNALFVLPIQVGTAQTSGFGIMAIDGVAQSDAVGRHRVDQADVVLFWQY